MPTLGRALSEPPEHRGVHPGLHSGAPLRRVAQTSSRAALEGSWFRSFARLSWFSRENKGKEGILLFDWFSSETEVKRRRLRHTRIPVCLVQPSGLTTHTAGGFVFFCTGRGGGDPLNSTIHQQWCPSCP